MAASKFFGASNDKAEKAHPNQTLGKTFKNVQNNIVPTNMDGEKF